jgi:hypothetical protein
MFFAVRYAEAEAGQIEKGEVIAEFRDEKTAKGVLQDLAWQGHIAFSSTATWAA